MRARDVAAARGAEAPRIVRRLRDPDAGRGDDLERGRVRFGGAQLERRLEQAAAVVGEADAERLGELARARAELALLVAATAVAHRFDPPARLERADQDGGGLALRLGDRVQQAVDAVGEVDVGRARRAPEDLAAGSRAAVGVAGGVVAVIALGLDDRAADAVVAQRAADQVAGDVMDRAREEALVESERGAHARASSSARAAASCSATRTEAVPPAERFDSSHWSEARTS